MKENEFIKKIKDLNTTLHNFYQLPNGKLRKLIDRLESKDDLPAVSKFWAVGDYILVLEDETVPYDSATSGPPSTMYVVIPGLVQSIKLNKSIQGGADGMESSEITGQSFEGNFFPGTQIDSISYGTPMTNPPKATEVARVYYDNFQDTELRGEVNKDYITLSGLNQSNQNVTYFYVVSKSGERDYSAPLRITAPVPFATESLVGGFLNVPGDAYGNGYVRMDDSGHLYLVDKDLYNSGILAYTLTEDVNMPSGLTAAEIQETLTEYVNSRIAMPFVADSSAAIDFAEREATRKKTYTKLSSSESDAGITITRPKDPNCVNVTITLSPWDSDNEIYIRELDSRFNTYVHLHINGSVSSGTRIYIADCAKIRLDINTIDASTNQQALPTIAVYRSNLYYDADVMDAISYMENISLWYDRYEDDAPNLVVDGMTVICQDETIEPTNIQSYDPVYGVDTHYRYALHDITFDTNGYIIGFGLLVGNESTAGDEEGSSITTAEFSVPQSDYFNYPETRLNKSMKVSGSFVAAYEFSGEESGYVVKHTTFSASTQERVPGSMQNAASGVIAFHTKVEKISSVTGLSVSPDAILSCWDSKSYHLFKGGIIA